MDELTWPPTPSLDRMQAPHHGAWTRRAGEPCRLVDHSALVGEFLDWLHGQGVTLAKWGHETVLVPIRRSDLPMAEWGEKPRGVARHIWMHDVVRYDEVEQDVDVLVPDGRSVDKLLHEYFQVDPEAEESEKRAVFGVREEVRDVTDIDTSTTAAFASLDLSRRYEERRMDPIKCPSCGSTTWKRLEDGTEHSEDLLDTATGKASELEDDHDNTDTMWQCFGCGATVETLVVGMEPDAADEFWQKLDDALGDAVWEDTPLSAKPLSPEAQAQEDYDVDHGVQYRD